MSLHFPLFYWFKMTSQVALTGGIACGKSMAEACFRACGCRVLDADRVVWALEAPGGEAVEPIVARFGRDILGADGGIDRTALAERVFGDAQARQALEAIVHPLVRAAVARWLGEAQAGEVSVFSAALLYECGWEAAWPVVVCVTASEATQVRRMVEKRGMSEAQARARLASQMPVAEKARRAQWVLRNDTDDLDALKAQVEEVLAAIRRDGQAGSK